ncbi:class I SAM-dependent methyltransferase [Echinicola sp. 20G]|uniref:THUMP-like domain-containing protein n=1 Tax=Echinicola sp. 20G TaxID=2781961 RepID=UPI00191116F2|nr:class I SAM-dependent methyltransferase [Echinicola sp. 20G]
MEASKIYTPLLFQFVQDHLFEDPAQLLLKHHQNTSLDVKEAVQQISARKKAQLKLPSWVANPNVIFPPSISLEQCSSELTAKFKSRLARGASLVDLTGGFGVDTFFLGAHFDKVLYLERQEKLAEIAAMNFSQLSENKVKYEVRSGDSIDYLRQTESSFDWIFVDPARRGGHNQKLYKLADCEPDIITHWEMMTRKASHIMVKASPMLDIKEALREIPAVSHLHVVAVKNEVKEILLIWDRDAEVGSPRVSCWNLSEELDEFFEFSYEEETLSQATFGFPEKYLVLPSAAILKAGAFKSFSQQYGLKKLHPNTHVYTSDKLIAPVQGRVFEILEEQKLDKKQIKKTFPSGKVNVLVRNHPLKPDMIKKKFKLQDGGDEYLFAVTTLDDSPKVYKCKRVG